MRSSLAATLAIAILTGAAYAANPRPGGSTPAQPTEGSPASIYAPLAKARSLFYSGKPEDSLALLEDLANSDKFQIRMEARFLAGRCLWLSDSEKDQKQAQKIWDQFAKEIVDWKPGPVRIAIAKSLVLESAGDETQAIRTLEAAVGRNVRNVATPEAQIELAKLLARNGRVEEAKQQLASAEDLLNRETKVEMHKDEAAPYYAAIKVTRDNLKYDANPGLAEVEQADKLRSDKKFAEAGKLYEQIIRQWPKSESADRATVGMGHCLLAVGKSAPAADLWRKFIAAAPAARWRGQATTALLDMGLEGQLSWEETRKLAAWAETTLPTALADDKAKPSWQAAVYSLNLQLAAIHWISGQYEPAGAALDQCIKLSEGDRAKRLSSLAEVVRAKKSLLPDGIVLVGNAGQMDPASVVLSMSVIEALAEQYESSEHFATLVANGRLAGTPNQRAFATFLQICLDDTVGPVAAQHLAWADPTASAPPVSAFRNPLSALSVDQRYLQLTKAYPDAPWLDEVIYRLAARNDKTAEKATDTDPMKLKRGSAPAATADSKPAPARADGDLFTFTDNELPPVLTAYRRVIAGYPESPRRERALWRVGRICLDTGRADEADQAFATQYQGYPQGAYAGDALIRLIDVALEFHFDLAAATKLADAAVQWAGVERQPAADATSLDPWRMIGRLPNLPMADWVQYEVYLRAGTIAYVQEDFDRGIAMFDLGRPPELRQGPTPDLTHSGLSLFALKNGCKKKLIPWDDRGVAACRTDQQRLAIKLADLYLYGVRADRALKIFTRFHQHDPLLMPVTADLEGYCTLRLALSYGQSRTNMEEAKRLYGLFYKPPLSQSQFVPDAILRLGVVVANTQDNPAASRAHYAYVLKHFPNNQYAEKALYFYCLDTIALKEVGEARKAADQFVTKFAGTPNSSWRQHVLTELKRLEEDEARPAKKGK